MIAHLHAVSVPAGFKSYANTFCGPFSEFCGIIGANGAGKSVLVGVGCTTSSLFEYTMAMGKVRPCASRGMPSHSSSKGRRAPASSKSAPLSTKSCVPHRTSQQLRYACYQPCNTGLHSSVSYKYRRAQVTVSFAVRQSSHKALHIRRTLSSKRSELQMMLPGETQWSGLTEVMHKLAWRLSHGLNIACTSRDLCAVTQAALAETLLQYNVHVSLVDRSCSFPLGTDSSSPAALSSIQILPCPSAGSS